MFSATTLYEVRTYGTGGLDMDVRECARNGTKTTSQAHDRGEASDCVERALTSFLAHAAREPMEHPRRGTVHKFGRALGMPCRRPLAPHL
jgi:hypothetical protein